jgi:hypothetical protein
MTQASSSKPQASKKPTPAIRTRKPRASNRAPVVLRFPARACVPEADAVLREQGIPPERVDGRIVEALAESLRLFMKLAEPAGITAEVTKDEFGRIFRGAGRNAPDNPLKTIYPRAQRLALFAVTVGPKPERLVARLFKEGKFELGYLLDAVASSAADRLAALMQQAYEDEVRSQKSGLLQSAILNLKSEIALRYSPGYCGWDLTGQRALFRRLRPGQVGMRLRRSCLMEPLKSVSGVFVLAEPDTHRFRNDFPFCKACTTKSCRSRIAALPGSERKPRAALDAVSRHEKHKAT